MHFGHCTSSSKFCVHLTLSNIANYDHIRYCRFCTTFAHTHTRIGIRTVQNGNIHISICINKQTKISTYFWAKPRCSQYSKCSEFIALWKYAWAWFCRRLFQNHFHKRTVWPYATTYYFDLIQSISHHNSKSKMWFWFWCRACDGKTGFLSHSREVLKKKVILRSALI